MLNGFSKPLRTLLCVISGVLCCSFIAACTPRSTDLGTVRLAVADDYRPYVYTYQGQLTGIDIEIAQMIAGKLGRKLEIVPVNFSELIEYVQSDKADMAMTALAITEERRKAVDFSDPYEFSGMRFLIRAGENIRHLPDMKDRSGFRVGVEMGSTAYELIDRDKTLRLIGYKGNREAVLALLNHQNDAVLLDHMVAVMMQLEHSERLVLLGDKLNHEEFAVAVSKKDPGLLKAANDVVHSLWKNGELQNLQQKHA